MSVEKQGRTGAVDWYVVSTDGQSALRIAQGLKIGETDSGSLALNDPLSGNQWIEFAVNEVGNAWIEVITPDCSIHTESGGRPLQRHRVRPGTTLEFPNNTLHITRDLAVPDRSGPVLEIVEGDRTIRTGRPSTRGGP